MKTYMNHKLTFRLLFTLLLCMFSCKTFAYSAKIDGVYYNFHGEEAEVIYKEYSDHKYISDYSGVITIPTSVTYNDKTYVVTSIGKSAFQNCSGLREMYCYAEQVPATNYNIFYGSLINEATLHVPAESLEDYRNTAPWKDFGSIVALTENELGVVEIQNDMLRLGVKNGLYDLNGRKLYKLQRGINIIRDSDGSAKKVMVR